jgi:hypothetical protein
MKKQLIRVGFYKELKHGRPDGESLKAVLQPVAGDDDAKLVQYLKAGKPMMVAPGPVRDVLANGIIGTLSILTDGEYAWPSDLAYYVERHHARAPVEFVEHVRARGFAVPGSIDLATLELK